MSPFCLHSNSQSKCRIPFILAAHTAYCVTIFSFVIFGFFLAVARIEFWWQKSRNPRFFLPGPSQRLAPVIKCNAFLSFQSYIVRDISLTEIYHWLVTFESVR